MNGKLLISSKGEVNVDRRNAIFSRLFAVRCEGELRHFHMDYVENNDIHHEKVTGLG